LKKPVEHFLGASGANLCNGRGFEELRQFQDYLSDYKNIVFNGSNPGRVMFSGNSLSAKKLYLLYDNGHYNLITKLKGAMAKKYNLMGVTLYTTIRTNVTKYVPYVLLHHRVLRMRPNLWHMQQTVSQ